MLKFVLKTLTLQKQLLAGLFVFAGCGLFASAQTTNAITKLVDFQLGQDSFGTPNGCAQPIGKATLVGTNYWFLSQGGGLSGVGAITTYNPATGGVTQINSLDNNSGKMPFGTLLAIGNQGWFTTSSGGAGNKGSLAFVDFTTGAITNVYSFPTNLINGGAPHGDLTLISNELWFTTSSGGFFVAGGVTNSAKGTLVKYNLTNNSLTLLFTFDGTNYGGSPFGGFTQVGNAYYFSTFNGGTNIGTGFPLGGGTLGKLVLDVNGAPIITKILDLPTNSPSSFPTATPTLVDSNSLWFTTTGNATFPGGLGRYDLVTGTFSNMYSFTVNGSTNFGKLPYSAVTVWNDELYLTTLQGGSQSKGVLVKFSLSNNVMTKLSDFEGNLGLALGGTPQYNESQILQHQDTGRYFLNLLIKNGGLNGTGSGNGTMIEVTLPPPPINVNLAAPDTNHNLMISWTGGYGPFTVQACPDFSIPGSWTNIASNLSTNSFAVPMAGNCQFFRVVGNP